MNFKIKSQKRLRAYDLFVGRSTTVVRSLVCTRALWDCFLDYATGIPNPCVVELNQRGSRHVTASRRLKDEWTRAQLVI